jgi:hypothetical protein
VSKLTAILRAIFRRQPARHEEPIEPTTPRPKDRLDYIAEAEARRPRLLR